MHFDGVGSRLTRYYYHKACIQFLNVKSKRSVMAATAFHSAIVVLKLKLKSVILI